MDYAQEVPVERLKKVIDGERGGISESANWQGGGEFIYCELMEYNQVYMEAIQVAQSSEELVALWEDIAVNSFLNYYVNPETPTDAVKDFKAIGETENGLEEQKQLLAELLDKNQLYVHLTEIDDEDFSVREGDKALKPTILWRMTMKTTGNQNVSELLRLTPRQQRVLEDLKDRETEEYPLSRWYLGALYTLHNEQNPDRIAQAAHSLRELIEKLPRVVEGSDVQGPPPNFHQSRDTIRKRILKDKENYASGWENKKIDRHLDNTLKQVEKYLESSQQPSRRERMQTAVTSIDPMANRFHRQIREGKRDGIV